MPPAMQVFDASSREYCTVRETRTNTPLQALNLMNDTTYVEAARMMAQRMLSEGGTKPEDRIALGLRLAAGRPPDESERQVLLGNLQITARVFPRPSAGGNAAAGRRGKAERREAEG